MKLLEAEPTGAPSAPDAPAAADPAAQAPARACERCGAPMEPDQDWCLSCGAAAPGRLGERPGWRAATTVLALTLALVAGSVAAAYAALTSNATQEAAAPPPPPGDAVAQAPAATPPSSATPPPPKTVIPKVPTPSPGTSTGSGSVRPITPTPTTSTPTTSTPSSSGTPTSTQPTTTPKPDKKPTAPASSTTKPPDPVPIELPATAGALYDPGGQAVAPTDPAKALDGTPGTFFAVGAKTDAWGLGYVIDVQKLRGLRGIRIATPSPGFDVQIFATDLATPPPAIDDTRWAHIHLTLGVASKDNPEIIGLGSGEVSKYRTLLIWITKGPTDGTRVRLSDISVLG